MNDYTLVNAHLEGDAFFWEGGSVGVLLLHGLTATPAEVRPLAKKLHQLGYTVAGPLLPGHGTTPDDLNQVSWQDWLWTAETSYHHLATVCDYVFVGGESTGAVIALQLATQQTNITGILAFAPSIRLNLSMTDMLKMYAALPFIDQIEKENADGHPLWQGYGVYPLWGTRELLLLADDTEHKLGKINQPVFIVQGRLDETIDPECGRIIVDGIQSSYSELHWMEESGHVVILDHEIDDIVALTRKFIQKAIQIESEIKYPEPALKALLQKAAENEFAALPNLFEVALAMVHYIGTTDAELRDNLIAGAFYDWVLEQALFTETQLEQLLGLAVDSEHLFYQMGEQGTDSVFTRSFSMLMLPLLLIVHREKRPFLSKSQVLGVKTAVLYYLASEQDLRGYVEGSGWAHAIAHAADALDDLAQASELEKAELLELLEGIRGAMCRQERPFTHEEDERMVTAVLAVLGRDLISVEEWASWLNSFLEHSQTEEDSPTNYQRLNAKTFLRSLYFRVADEGMREVITAVLQKSSRFK